MIESSAPVARAGEFERRRDINKVGQPVELTAKEFDLLHVLAAAAGRAFTREELLNKVWDYEYFGDANTVTVHVRRLRSKARPPCPTPWAIS